MKEKRGREVGEVRGRVLGAIERVRLCRVRVGIKRKSKRMPPGIMKRKHLENGGNGRKRKNIIRGKNREHVRRN